MKIIVCGAGSVGRSIVGYLTQGNNDIVVIDHDAKALDVIAKEYDIEVTLDHATDARCIVEQIKESGYPCICGPSFGHKTKFELKSKSFKTPGVLNKAGILVSITTDSPVIPEQYLSLCAALAAKEGMDEYEAIKAITINPAKILKLDNRVGSIKVGKDADFIICTKNILDTTNEIKSVYIDGKKAV